MLFWQGGNAKGTRDLVRAVVEKQKGKFSVGVVKIARQRVGNNIFSSSHMLGVQAGSGPDDSAAQTTGNVCMHTMGLRIEG